MGCELLLINTRLQNDRFQSSLKLCDLSKCPDWGCQLNHLIEQLLVLE
jgi:hypothetical protein